MSVPKTYLLTAPSDIDNTFGRPIHHADLIRGLKKINPLIRAWDNIPDGIYWPGKAFGNTTLWFGQYGSRKICAFTLGMIPEFTQVHPDGTVMMRGWRSIFEKVIKIGAATKESIENKFKVSLEIDGNDSNCKSCRMDGKIVKGEGASGLCNLHEQLRRIAWKARQEKDEIRYRQKKGQSCQLTQSRPNDLKMVFLTGQNSISSS